METKPNSFLVGIITLIILLAGTGFVVWFSKMDIGKQHNLYRIDFEGAVTGLRENEDVLYQGIPIGKVKKIRVFKDDVNRIKVIVDINRPDLIRESSIATIEAQGLTGYTFVQIKGSDQQSPLLVRKEGNRHPVIQSQRSSLETLFSKAPLLLDNLADVAMQLEKFFDDKMVQDSRAALHNLRVLTDELASGPESLKSVLKDVKVSLREVGQASKTINRAMAQNEKSLAYFMGTGLPAVTKMSQKVEVAADHIADFTKMLRQGPLGVLSKTPNQGYKVPNK